MRLWGFPAAAVEYVKRWTITRNRSGNYSYQTPDGQRFTARDSVRELLQQMQTAGRFEGEGFVLLGFYARVLSTSLIPPLVS